MILAILPLSFGAGILALNGSWLALYVVPVIWILFRWVLWDAAKRNAKVSWPLRISLVALTAFALPCYFFLSRGWKGGVLLLTQAWGIFIAAMLCYSLGYSLT